MLIRTLRKYCELYGNKFDKGWNRQIFERQRLPKFTQEVIDNMASAKYFEQIEGLDDFTGKFYQIFKEELIRIIYQLF